MDPVRPADDAARAEARRLLAAARVAALAVLAGDGAPQVSRIAFGLDPAGRPLTLVSDLAGHAQRMAEDPRVSLLLGEPGPKGDPLTHPRLTLQARALSAESGEREALTAHWLRQHPKARLYAGFADFRFVRFAAESAFLNAGFGRAHRLTPQDLCL